MYLKKQVPSGSAWKTPKVVQPGERGSYRDENYHIKGPGFLKVTARRTGAIAVSAAVGCGPQAGPPAGEPQPGDPPSLPAPGRHQLRVRLCPSGRTVSRLLSLGPPLHRAHLKHPYSSPQGFPDLRLPQGGSPWRPPVPPCRAHTWYTLKEPTTHHGVTRVCTLQKQTMCHGVTRVCMLQELTTHHRVTRVCTLQGRAMSRGNACVHAAGADHASQGNACVHAAGADHMSRGNSCVHAAGVGHVTG